MPYKQKYPIDYALLMKDASLLSKLLQLGARSYLTKIPITTFQRILKQSKKKIIGFIEYVYINCFLECLCKSNDTIASEFLNKTPLNLALCPFLLAEVLHEFTTPNNTVLLSLIKQYREQHVCFDTPYPATNECVLDIAKRKQFSNVEQLIKSHLKSQENSIIHSMACARLINYFNAITNSQKKLKKCNDSQSIMTFYLGDSNQQTLLNKAENLINSNKHISPELRKAFAIPTPLDDEALKQYIKWYNLSEEEITEKKQRAYNNLSYLMQEKPFTREEKFLVACYFGNEFAAQKYMGLIATEKNGEYYKKSIYIACLFNHINIVRMLVKHYIAERGSVKQVLPSWRIAFKNCNFEMLIFLLENGSFLYDTETDYAFLCEDLLAQPSKLPVFFSLIQILVNTTLQRHEPSLAFRHYLANIRSDCRKALYRFKHINSMSDDDLIKISQYLTEILLTIDKRLQERNELLLQEIYKQDFYYAIVEGNIPKIKSLLETTNIKINIPLEEGNTPLHIAIQSQQYDVVNYLLKEGANIHKRNDKDNTPLYFMFKNYCWHNWEAYLISRKLLTQQQGKELLFNKNKKDNDYSQFVKGLIKKTHCSNEYIHLLKDICEFIPNNHSRNAELFKHKIKEKIEDQKNNCLKHKAHHMIGRKKYSKAIQYIERKSPVEMRAQIGWHLLLNTATDASPLLDWFLQQPIDNQDTVMYYRSELLSYACEQFQLPTIKRLLEVLDEQKPLFFLGNKISPFKKLIKNPALLHTDEKQLYLLQGIYDQCKDCYPHTEPLRKKIDKRAKQLTLKTLFDSALQDDPEQIRKHLTQKNLSVNIHTFSGFTLLHVAANCNHLALLCHLLARDNYPDISPWIKDDHGNTALHHACYCHAFSVVERFLEEPQGLRKFFFDKNSKGETPYDIFFEFALEEATQKNNTLLRWFIHIYQKHEKTIGKKFPEHAQLFFKNLMRLCKSQHILNQREIISKS